MSLRKRYKFIGANVLDWKHLDRLILLACLVLLAPLLYSIFLTISNHYHPDIFNQKILNLLKAGYIFHVCLLSLFIMAALYRRKLHDTWSLFEDVIIVSYIIVIMSTAYLTGVHLREGLLLLFAGISISTTLANVYKVRWFFAFSLPIMLVMIITDFVTEIPYAILFEQSPYDLNGKPLVGWRIYHSVNAIIIAALMYLYILSNIRWVERESIYRKSSMIDGLTLLSNRTTFVDRGKK